MELDHISFPEAVKKLAQQEVGPEEIEQLSRQREAEQGKAMEITVVDPKVLDSIIAYHQEDLAHTKKAQEYLEERALWMPDVLRPLRIGYSSGNLPRILPADDNLRQQLCAMGLLTDKGRDFFLGRIVVPIFDETGVLVSVYGRAITLTSKVPHLYVRGPHRGVFNRVAIQEAQTVILAESVFDALSIIILGFPNTTASYGANGFTADHLTTFKRAKTSRVYCAYDADPAGDEAATHLAQELAPHGIEVHRVQLPCKDPNDFLKGGGTHQDFQKLLEEAKVIGVPKPSPCPTAATPQAPKPNIRVFRFEERTYEVRALPQPDSLSLKIRLKVCHEDRTFLNTFNLYADAARGTVVRRLMHVFGGAVTKRQIEKDLLAVIEHLDGQSPAKPATATATAPADEMSPADRETALTFLRSPDLVETIRAHLAILGVVGEERAKLLVYLVATSRILPTPLSLVVVSRSGAGKSFLVAKVSELMPLEERYEYTRVSAKVLFHEQTDRLKHKLMTIEEAQGMEEANYAIRVLLSNRKITNLTTVTNPVTGRHEAQENVVYGPVALIVTTTQELDFETASRAFVMSVDESVEQTERIHQAQREAYMPEGLDKQVEQEAIVRLHQNAQRLLKPLAVVNPYARRLTFPTATLRLRREHPKYLTLMATITFLFQYQRKQGVREVQGQQIPYVETDPADIDLANELVVTSLRQALEEVTTPARSLLALIRKMVIHLAEGEPLTTIRFCRRELREHTKWADHAMRGLLKELEDLELVCPVSGSFGKQYVYMLSPDHRLALAPEGTLADEIRELGLTSAADLVGKDVLKK
jgi:hypothetical protein